uniref:EF-hand domain-containing family member C2 n=1 Tax=Trypanosoma congolense (strain IL3000) TaxID=1068625 RepID=G0ULT6_TRYCI|nr:conserved hypothetical protein [Trypanosoma congolense IL3000]
MDSMNTSSYDHEVPIKYIRTVDPKLLPPRVGHNWLDPAFRKKQDKPQQLEAEFRGKRAPLLRGVYDRTPPEGLGLTARQLIQALSERRNGSAPDGRPVFTTLSDKVLRFYAFFSEKTPEGCCEEYWHRCVEINFYPEDDTILIQEPCIPNSGLRGGVFLKRQKVRADPRQREQFPNDEFLTINHFNVGCCVRINCHDFFLYDCDAFTRDFLTEMGVEVGEPTGYPETSFMSQWKKQQERMQSANFGIASHECCRDDALRAARFVLDSGKVLRFYGVLDERGKAEGGMVRRLELVYYVEDGSIALLERSTTNESVPSLFLSRCWLPKAGTIEKTLEFTFAHRMNGMREPFLGPQGRYSAQDLGIGVTINVLGRNVFLYDCDDFTRSYYMETFGMSLPEAVDCLSEYGLPPKQCDVMFRSNATPASATAAPGQTVLQKQAEVNKKETLRYLLRLTSPCTSAERMRRFTLTYYTDTKESMIFESPIKNSGYTGGCFRGRSRLPNPSAGPDAFYTYEDFIVGSVIVVNAHKFEIMSMDEHTANFLACKGEAPLNEEQLQLLVDAFRLFLRTRFHSYRDAFLGFDRDKDSVISVTEFVDHVVSLQIAIRRMDAEALFNSIVQCPETGYLTLQTFVDWMNQEEAHNNGVAETETKECININERALLRKALRQLCARLEARCLNSLQMFRLASTMPRAYTGRRADCYSLSNPQRDAYVTPVQLRRCIEEVLGGNPSPQELDSLLGFFFPLLPANEYRCERDVTLDHALDLKEFQKKYHDMCTLDQLP